MNARAEEETFKAADRLKAYQAMAETSRKWANVMDTKAGFLSALNLGCLAFAWSSAKLHEGGGTWVLAFLLIGTFFAASSLAVALHAVIPRGTLSEALGKKAKYAPGFKPISFYGFVASKYPAGKIHDFVIDVRNLDEELLATEALEQHYTISHVVQRKAARVVLAGVLCGLGVAFVAGGAIIKGVTNWTQNQEPSTSKRVIDASKTFSKEGEALKSVGGSQAQTP